MWRRTYLLLLVIRVYFALSPSYLHPDENFQGPEVFAGRHFSYPSSRPWEFTSDHPIRSVFPLWPVYDVPMSLLKWFYTEMGTGNPPPELVYNVLRGVMFLLSFVLEDWAIYEFVPSPRHRAATIALVASSYVTWTYQTHTFSNSLETLLVAWGLVLIRRIVENKRRSSHFSCAVLAFIAVTGIFNRITFPAFLILPGLQLLPHFRRKSVTPSPALCIRTYELTIVVRDDRPLSILSLTTSGLFFSFLAILGDTIFYKPTVSFTEALRAPIITPLNNFLYNSDSSNLALHGLHPHYQHFLANLPQLLGPAYTMMIASLVPAIRSLTLPTWMQNMRAVSAISATIFLSIFPHQEPRFLIPCVPLLLSCFRLHTSRLFLVSWVVFNAALGFLMGVYHQGGVIPTQLAIPSILSSYHHVPGAVPDAGQPTTTVFWWKTYSPPRWLLGDARTDLDIDITTRDLMGIPGPDLIHHLDQSLPACPVDGNTQGDGNAVFVVAPKSATFLDRYIHGGKGEDKQEEIELQELYIYPKHLNLDDLDFGDDGVFATLGRVVGRRGLGVWAVRRRC